MAASGRMQYDYKQTNSHIYGFVALIDSIHLSCSSITILIPCENQRRATMSDGNASYPSSLDYHFASIGNDNTLNDPF
jgi:hypothetical protein